MGKTHLPPQIKDNPASIELNILNCKTECIMGTTYVHLSQEQPRLYSVHWEEAFCFQIYFFPSRADIFPFFYEMQNVPLTLAEKTDQTAWLKFKRGAGMPLNPNKTNQISHYITYKQKNKKHLTLCRIVFQGIS